MNNHKRKSPIALLTVAYETIEKLLGFPDDISIIEAKYPTSDGGWDTILLEIVSNKSNSRIPPTVNGKIPTAHVLVPNGKINDTNVLYNTIDGWIESLKSQ